MEKGTRERPGEKKDQEAVSGGENGGNRHLKEGWAQPRIGSDSHVKGNQSSNQDQ